MPFDSKVQMKTILQKNTDTQLAFAYSQAVVESRTFLFKNLLNRPVEKLTINTLDRFHTLFCCFYYWLWTSKCWLSVIEQKQHLQFSFLYTARKLKFSITDFFSKCDQIRRKLRIWLHLLKKSLMEAFVFCAVLNMFYIKFLKEFHYGFCLYFTIEHFDLPFKILLLAYLQRPVIGNTDCVDKTY